MAQGNVVIIGAGPSGLAACKTLLEFGVEFECLEASDGVGGIWNVERGGGGYRSLETNTPTVGMAYSDFPFEEDSPVYPDAAQMVDYFNRYVDHFEFREKIRFNTRVSDVSPNSDGQWELQLDTGETRIYSQVIVASGQYTFPKRIHESIPGEFTGDQLHVFDYFDVTTPVDLRGKRVIVVGLGTSAAEIAAEVSKPGNAAHTLLSARSGRWVVPKNGDGAPLEGRAPHPADRVPPKHLALPNNQGTEIARQRFGASIRQVAAGHGGAAALGLPEPKSEPWEDRPTKAGDFIPALQTERIDVRPGIDRFEGSTVHFTDGTQTDADVIIYATGYRLDFPFMKTEVLGCDSPDLALYQRIAHPHQKGLFFVGCLRVMCSLWPVAEQQSRWVARLLSGGFDLPPAGAQQEQAVELTKVLPVMCNFYIEGLREEAGGF